MLIDRVHSQRQLAAASCLLLLRSGLGVSGEIFVEVGPGSRITEETSSLGMETCKYEQQLVSLSFGLLEEGGGDVEDSCDVGRMLDGDGDWL